ncbi:hypothetical protein [Hymenobacter weizhouensis]|uniref:hypothetical protein n=1 Tax=Hymenobacter sp. YIM 151500-1 TaxID=2987689 RepID=UPI002226565C|nr:hypothetical protein [Hymenobacter sp. YIM 151500-1]UYZ63969.1 hypothetical protein OIS53_03780 [Hymenobacter sp. YIM 151500-1]
MKLPSAPSSPHDTSPVSALQASLRQLYRSARYISHKEPYAAARLARIADQAEYFLHEWPADQWPDRLSPSSQPLPARSVLLAWLATAKHTASQTDRAKPCSYSCWRQVTTTLLAALAPFA